MSTSRRRANSSTVATSAHPATTEVQETQDPAILPLVTTQEEEEHNRAFSTGEDDPAEFPPTHPSSLSHPRAPDQGDRLADMMERMILAQKEMLLTAQKEMILTQGHQNAVLIKEAISAVVEGTKNSKSSRGHKDKEEDKAYKDCPLDATEDEVSGIALSRAGEKDPHSNMRL